MSQESSPLAVADSLMRIGNYSKAIEVYSQIPHSELKLARANEAIGNVNNALKWYEVGLQKEPELLWAQFRYASLMLSSGSLIKADSLFLKLSTEYPQQPEFLYQIGVIKQKQGTDSLALNHFNTALQLDPLHQKARYKVARHHLEHRAFKMARHHIDHGLKNDPDDRGFLILKAHQYYYDKAYHDASKLYELLLKNKSRNKQLHEKLALCYHNTNRFEKAIEQFTILINTFNDKNPKWHYQIGRAYTAVRDYEKAQRHYEIAIILKSLSKEQEYMALSFLFSAQGKYPDQIEALKKVIHENPENQKAHYMLAATIDSYYKDKTKAISHYKKYLTKFGEQGTYSQLALQRIKDIKNEAFFDD